MYHHRNQASKSRFTKVYNQDLRRPVHVQLKKDNRAAATVPQRPLPPHSPALPHQKKSQLLEKSCSDYVQLRQVMASQKELLAKLEKATTAQEKTALSESLKLAVFHAKDLQRNLEEKHKVLVVEGGSMKKKRNSFSLKRPASVASSESGSSSECSSSSAAHLKRCRFESGSSSNSSISVSSSKK